MKMQENFQTAPDFDGHNFKINSNAKAFKILSSNLYSDKILAVVRELSCNAWDSHIEAGNTDMPFIVSIPDGTSNKFTIRDFGTGLSTHDVLNVYTTYFESTKTDSNEVTGALGLGSKSPFSIVDQFMVDSFYDGVRYEYIVFFGGNGYPQIKKLQESNTTQPNGLMITIEDDWSRSEVIEFESAVKEIYKWFPVQPVVNHMLSRLTPTEYTPFKSSDIKLYYKAGWDNNPIYIKQGLVAYPISHNRLHTLEANLLTSLKGTIVFDVPIGSVDIAPSREALSFDNRTTAYIESLISRAYDEIKHDIISKSFNESNSLWKINKNLNNWVENNTITNCLSSHIANLLRTTYNQTFPNRNFFVDISHILNEPELNVKFIEVGHSKAKTSTNINFSDKNKKDRLSFDNIKNIAFFINDAKTGYMNKLRYMTQNKKQFMIVLDPVNRRNYNSDLINRLLAPLGLPDDVVYYSSTCEVQLPERIKSENIETKLSAYSVSKFGSIKKVYIEDEDDQLKNAYFFNMERKHILTMDGIVNKDIDSGELTNWMSKAAKVLGYGTISIMGCSKQQRKHIEAKNIKLLCGYKLLQDIVDAVIGTVDTTQHLVHSCFSRESVEGVFYETIEKHSCDPILVELVVKARAINSTGNETNKLSRTEYRGILETSLKMGYRSDDVREEISKSSNTVIINIKDYIINKYSFTHIVDFHSWRDDNDTIEAFVSTMNLVYSSENAAHPDK